MSDHFSRGPNPLLPPSSPLFPMSAPSTSLQKSTPMMRERAKDGTPLTATPPTPLGPAEPSLILKGMGASEPEDNLKEEEEEDNIKERFNKAQNIVKAYMEQ